jgi:hypothetical protein
MFENLYIPIKDGESADCVDPAPTTKFLCRYPPPFIRQQCVDRCNQIPRTLFGLRRCTYEIPLPCDVKGVKCPNPYQKTNECVCDLRSFARSHSDWPIAVMVGAATYGQLLDAAPGLFEPFPDYRARGNSANSIQSVSYEKSKIVCDSKIVSPEWISKEASNPTPPNFVSTFLVEKGLSVADMKRLLIRAVWGNDADPRISDLVASSRSYRNPELSLFEIVITFAIYAVIVTIIISFFFRTVRLMNRCGHAVIEC